MPFRSKAPQVRAAIVEALRRGGEEVGLRIEAAAKAELYPGHGKITGTLQRSIQSGGAIVEAKRIRIRVGTKGVPYALKIHKKYGYLAEGVKKTAPRAREILVKYVKGSS